MKPFDIFKKMADDDTANNSANLKVSVHFLGGQTVRGGDSIKMGCETGTLTQIATDEVMPILLIVSKKEYARLKDIEPTT